MDTHGYSKPLPLKDVSITGGFWKSYVDKVREKVIPYQWDALNDRVEGAEPSNCMRNFRIVLGKEEGAHRGFVFQDSDAAKWIEAAAYSLECNPDQELELLIDGAIDEIVAAQLPDGYLNTYYIITGKDLRFTNLRDNHELYCLGHFLEAGVAYFNATGKNKLLNALIKYVDLVDELIGPEEGKLHGYPGHEEIELALVKLYNVTKNERHLRLAEYFINERGKKPCYFIEEQERNGKPFKRENSLFQFDYFQASEPVREQNEAVGHSVRAVYLYSGMADVARETNDESLFAACRRLWDNMTRRRMYITGGIGSSHYGEAFTFDYDLPNDTIYAETCASIGLVFFARRMLDIEPRGEYGDIMERCLYNGILSGMSYDGTGFFYVNPLEVNPEASARDQLRKHVLPVRPKWFGCACCPPNLARLLTSLGSYAYSTRGDSLFFHLFMSGYVETTLESGNVELEVKTNYPWDGTISVDINKAPVSETTLAVRIPAWCRRYSIKLNDMDIQHVIKDGYAYITKVFAQHDKLELTLDMPVDIMQANPRVRDDIGKLAVMRGPIVYCLEQADNGANLHHLLLSQNQGFKHYNDETFYGGAVLLESSGKRQSGWEENDLYRPAALAEQQDVTLKWIPYYLWANRGAGEMTVWVRGLTSV